MFRIMTPNINSTILKAKAQSFQTVLATDLISKGRIIHNQYIFPDAPPDASGKVLFYIVSICNTFFLTSA